MLYSCTNDKKEEFIPKELKINFSGKRQILKFNQYFDSARAISLETTPASLIGKISRIVYNKEKIYILDVVTNSVFIFNSTGKFLNKIHAIGSGPGKFIGLRDFSLDEENKRLILHSHRPYKLMYYSLEGTFLSEEQLNDYYYNIGVENNKLITVNTSPDKDYLSIN